MSEFVRIIDVDDNHAHNFLNYNCGYESNGMKCTCKIINIGHVQGML